MVESRRVSQGSVIFLYSSLGITEWELCFCGYMGIVFNYIWYIYFCLRISVITCAGRIWKLKGHHGSLCCGGQDTLVAGWMTMWEPATAQLSLFLILLPFLVIWLVLHCNLILFSSKNLTCKGDIKRAVIWGYNLRMFWFVSDSKL